MRVRACVRLGSGCASEKNAVGIPLSGIPLSGTPECVGVPQLPYRQEVG